LLLPPALALVGLVRGWRKENLGDWKKISPVILGVVTLLNWVVLVCFIANGKLGVGLDYGLSRWTPALLGLSLLSVVASIGAYAFRRSFLIASSLLLFTWFDIGYAPRHLLERVDFGSVSVNGQPVSAAVYIGNPTSNEAEAIALVHVPSVGNYLVDLSSGTFREALSHEVVVLNFGAWTWKPMKEGQFRVPLPFLRVNECRILMPDGRLMTIAF
jgi:hypothetical protein